MNSPPPSSPMMAEAALSSPTQRPLKPKGKPTVTPRSFRRFFTPRSSQLPSRKTYGTRNVLGDITGSGANRQYRVGRRRSPKKDSIRIFDDDENPESGSNNLETGRKRALYSPESLPDSSSPLKRFKSTHTEPDAVVSWAQDLATPDDDCQNNCRPISIYQPKPVVRSRFRRAVGQVARRELGMASSTHERTLLNYAPEWQSQVANFYTGPEDVHISRNLTSNTGQFAIPFCTASCNTNSLVAVGDEEGGVRLLETERDSKTPFKTPFLTFRPHTNAIIDLEFSSDDAYLATASGDQTGQVIDMPTQRTIYQLKGHMSTVKQVRFQPGSQGKVVATSSRDGSVQIWDLRCHGRSEHVAVHNVSLDANDHGEPTTYSSRNSVQSAVRTSVILDAHSTASSTTLFSPSVSGGLRNRQSSRYETSITAISFLSTENPNLLLTGSEADAIVKLWDLRMNYHMRNSQALPLSSTMQPNAHSLHRTFGLTSMATSKDGSRLYTLCKDSTVYAYSTQHLILGSAPELARSWKPRRNGEDKVGLAPLYAFRHEKLKASSFYVKAALRPQKNDHGELLAVGSASSGAVLFPTDEKYLNQKSSSARVSYDQGAPITPSQTPPRLRHSWARKYPLSDEMPVFSQGAALVGGHEKEVTSTVWSSEGELVTVGDDWRCRVWREDASRASDLRKNGEASGGRWGHGWADLGDSGAWDEKE